MNTMIRIIKCLERYIKKNFFNLTETDISQDCEKIPGMNFPEEKEKISEEEYASLYKSITRWQTL